MSTKVSLTGKLANSMHSKINGSTVYNGTSLYAISLLKIILKFRYY